APVIVLGLLGVLSVPFPQLLGNGRDVAQEAFTGGVGLPLLAVLVVLRPAMTIFCLGSGAPGGLFTPSLATGALLGGLLGVPWSWLFPGTPGGEYAVLGAAAVLAATTQGPISTAVLMMELTGHARASMVPMLLVIATATLVARTIEPRSVYDARLSDDEVRARQQHRDHAPPGLPP
ncbi:chloride channel protein, partial [Acidisphaera rubrifaciens]|uniref:chloride channel protein n=1 Tax=Acidisphaera rubrifaciens TaxID=50715 RepID=UPI000662B54D